MEHKKFGIHSLWFKILASLVIVSILMVAAVAWSTTSALTTQEQHLIAVKEQSDILYLEEMIGDGSWNIKDGALYKGDILVGDGTQENANLEPFLLTEERTGTFCYSFMKCSDDGLYGQGLVWVGDDETGYQQGHFVRTAGSTLSPTGESIVGTYIDKKVADILDAEGTYSGVANVAGGMIYCLYNNLYDDDGNVVGCTVVGRSINELNQQIKDSRKNIMTIMILAVVTAAVGLMTIINMSLKSIVKIEEYLARIGSGDFPKEALVVKSKDEISSVADAVNAMAKSLKENIRMGTELNVATKIQRDLLPQIFPAFPERIDFDIYASMNPAKEVGGDFYDFFLVDADHLCMVVADVSGKGVPAALFMVTAKTLIKDHAMNDTDLGNVFTEVNSQLCEGNAEGLFVTAWILIVNLKTGSAHFVNAGHNPPLIRRAGGKYEYLKSRPNMVLAGMEGIKYRRNDMMLNSGDSIFIYTDGVTEATSADVELYGEDRLENLLNEREYESMGDLCQTVYKDVMDFTGEADQFDDVTMLGFTFKGGSKIKEIVTDAVVDKIPELTAQLDAYLEEAGCPMKAQMQLDVAFDEIFSNISFYAYMGHVGTCKLVLDQPVDRKGVKLTFIDGGFPYNPLEHEDPNTNAKIEERGIGGLGILMVKKTMDDVCYEYSDNKNRLTLTKYFD